MQIFDIVTLYGALILVLTLHELGHLPTQIRSKFQYGFIPLFYAYKATNRMGGLVVNVMIFSLVFLIQPETLFLQFIGLVAWLHFIIYSIIGSIFPDNKVTDRNKSKVLLDDVPNEYGLIFIGASIAAFFMMRGYFLPILGGFLA